VALPAGRAFLRCRALVATVRVMLDDHHDPHVTEVHVLGFTITRRDAPWERATEPGVEIWGINNLEITSADTPVDRCHRWFDLHPAETLMQDQLHVDWLTGQQRPLYVFESAVQPLADAGVPNLRAFPTEALTGLYATRYFTNSISWLLAFAGAVMQPALQARKNWERVVNLAALIGEEPGRLFDQLGLDPIEPPTPKIGVWGVDMATDTEYGAQRPSCEYFIGLLAGAGFGIQVATGSDLLKTAGLYGTDDNGALRAKMLSRRAELNAQVAAAQGERSQVANRMGQLDGQIAHIQGAINDCTYWLDRWTMPDINREQASNPGQV